MTPKARRRIMDLHQTGHDAYAIAVMLADEGFKGIRPETVKEILKGQ